MPTAHTTETNPGEIASASRVRKFQCARAMVVPAVLMCVAALAAGCGSGSGSPSNGVAANTLIRQGLSAESSGQTQQAISDFTAAVAKNPTSAIAYYDLGVIYQLYLKQPSQAASYYNKAILANPKYHPALYNLAIVETPSNPQAAISLYNQLIQSNPNDSNSLYNLGLLLIHEGQQTQGQADVTKAIFINPALKNRLPAGVSP
jgi:tetratricopeptide (TPR) repeat protein